MASHISVCKNICAINTTLLFPYYLNKQQQIQELRLQNRYEYVININWSMTDIQLATYIRRRKKIHTFVAP